MSYTIVKSFRVMYGDNMQIMSTVKSQLLCNRDRVSMRTIEGKDHIVISGAKHMIGDSVMNRGLYRSEDMQRLSDELISTNAHVPAPLEHPSIGGEFISARDPRADIQHGGGAFHFNFRTENNRLVSDTAIDPEKAMLSARGRELLRRIDQEQPVDMSTGFFLVRNEQGGTGKDGVDYDWIASNLDMDHSALLIENPGAKTSDEGVGLFANTRDQKRCDLVVNSLEEAKPYQETETNAAIQWLKNVFNAANEKESSYNGNNNQQDEPNLATNNGDQEMIEELKAQVEALQETVTGLQANQADALKAAVTDAVKPLTDKLAAIEANAKQAEEAEKAPLVEAVVNSGLMGKEDAEKLSANALRNLAGNGQPFMMGGQMQTNSDQSMDMPE